MNPRKDKELDDNGPERSLKHEQLKNLIRDAILFGEFQPGDLIPSQNVMKRRYGVSHNTVREAIGSLVHEGLLYRIQGKGTYVSPRRVRKPVIGVILPHMHIPGSSRYQETFDINGPLFKGIEDAAEKNDVIVSLRLSRGDIAVERQNVLDMLEQRVQGIIMTYVREDRNLDVLEQVSEAGIPLVLIDRYMESLESDYVITDNYKASFEAVKKIKELGYNRICYVTIPIRSTALRDRLAGVQAATGSDSVLTSLTVGRLTSVTANAQEATSDVVSDWLQMAKPPFAIFACNPDLLDGSWAALKKSGIPLDQVLLGCFDDIPPAIEKGPTLLRVSQPLEKIGFDSVKIILEKLKGDTERCKIMLPADIQIVKN